MTTRDALDRIRLPRRLAGELGSDAAVVAIGQVIGLGAGMLTGIVTARELGPSGRGVLGLTLLVPTLLALFLGFGSAVANVYLLGSGEVDRRDLSRISLALCSIGTIVGGALVTILWASSALRSWLPHVPGSYLALSLLMLPISLLYGAFRAILRGLQEVRLTAVVDAAQSLCIAASTCIALLAIRTGVRGAIVANVVGGVVTLALLAIGLRGKGLSLRPGLPRPLSRRVVTFGLRGDLANLTQFFTYRFDSFFVNFLRTSAAVGIYAVGTRLAELIWVVPSAVAAVMVPRASAASAASLNEQTPRVFGKVLGLSLISGSALAGLGAVGIRLLYSGAFSGAYRPMLLLLPGAVLLGGATVLTGDVTGRGHPGYNTINSLVGVVVTIGLDLLLIPPFGIDGAASASSIAYAVNTVLAVVFFLRVSGVGWRDFTRRAMRCWSRPVAAAVG